MAATTSRAALAGVCLACAAALAQAAPASVHLEQLTWTELRERVAAGATIALVPVGGTEQNGPHMVLGKHNARVRVLAERIAQRLGNAVVAPVLAYVPEGTIDPPQGHMRWPGTISVPPAAFEAVLEGTARSLQRAGFIDVVLLGDHGGYRASLDRVAARVARVHALPEYYRASSEGVEAAFKAQGFGAAEIGQHAGLADTSLTLALDPSLVRIDVAQARAPGADDGARGDPRRARAELATQAVESIVAQTVAAIRSRTRR